MNGTPAFARVTAGPEPGTVQITLVPRDGGQGVSLALYYPGALNLIAALASAVISPGQPIVVSLLPVQSVTPAPPPPIPFTPGPVPSNLQQTMAINEELERLRNVPRPVPQPPPPATGGTTSTMGGKQ